MTVRPSSTSTFRPSISTVGMVASLVDPRGAWPHGTMAESGMILELGAILGHERAHRHRGGVGECADGVAHHVARDVEQQVDVGRRRVSLLEAVQDVLEPAGALAARRAL